MIEEAGPEIVYKKLDTHIFNSEFEIVEGLIQKLINYDKPLKYLIPALKATKPCKGLIRNYKPLFKLAEEKAYCMGGMELLNGIKHFE